MSIDPFDFLLVLYTHLQLITLIPFLAGIKCHVLFFLKDSNSEFMALFQFLLFKASSNEEGSLVGLQRLYLTCHPYKIWVF
jgi:hypothetical protein